MGYQLKKILPGPVLRLAATILGPLLLLREFLYDAARRLRHSSPLDGAVSARANAHDLEAQITKDYHRIEKGLSLREPKRPFGEAVGSRLATLLPSARLKSPDAPFVVYGEAAFAALERWNSDGYIDADVSTIGSTWDTWSSESLTSFFESRHSIRDFAKTDVPEETIRATARLATNTPSVCNRQAARIHYFSDPSSVSSVLAHQNGNAGFRDSVPSVAVLTVDSRLFNGVTERNQGWIDGGLFAMSWAWALHGAGLGTCFLNWSMTNSASKRFRNEFNIPEYEDIITLIAIGYPSSTHRVARSGRRPLEAVLNLHDIPEYR